MMQKIFDAIQRLSPQGHAFWIAGQADIGPGSIRLQDHPDIVYTLHLLDAVDEISPKAAQAYMDWLAGAALHGRPEGTTIAEKRPNAHLTAYLLGAVRLLEQGGKGVPPDRLYQNWKRDELIDANDLPIWPKAWTHHIWRVSHWIGGVPSILLQLAHSDRAPGIDDALVQRVLAACEARIIKPESGLLRPYRSQLVQDLFRTAYRLRHDPDLGEVGGVVHLLWVYHALDRPYVAGPALYTAAEKHLQTKPFLEAVPYCLDFDIVQLARTAKDDYPAALKDRAATYAADIAAFFEKPLPESYTLHKIPGALATMHECAFICGLETIPGLSTNRRDIIKDAYWI
jgi:hypothetical protein